MWFEIVLVVAKHICDYVNLGLPKNIKLSVKFWKEGKIMLLCVNNIFWTTKIIIKKPCMGFWASFYFAALHILDQGLQLLTTALIISL